MSAAWPYGPRVCPHGRCSRSPTQQFPCRRTSRTACRRQRTRSGGCRRCSRSNKLLDAIWFILVLRHTSRMVCQRQQTPWGGCRRCCRCCRARGAMTPHPEKPSSRARWRGRTPPSPGLAGATPSPGASLGDNRMTNTLDPRRNDPLWIQDACMQGERRRAARTGPTHSDSEAYFRTCFEAHPRTLSHTSPRRQGGPGGRQLQDLASALRIQRETLRTSFNIA